MDVVEYCVVFALKVFVQSFGVSCHCGLQSTVVHSRVRRMKLLDLQRNWSEGGIQSGWKSFFFHCFPLSNLKATQNEFRAVVSILFVPEEIIICWTGVIQTAKSYCLSFSSSHISLWLQHVVFLCSAFCKTQTNSISVTVLKNHVSVGLIKETELRSYQDT